MSAELIGKVALVTGGSRGIGRAIALALAEAGADVAVNFLSHEAEAKEVCSEIEHLGRRSLPVKADVSAASQVSRMVEVVQQSLGEISVLVHDLAQAPPLVAQAAMKSEIRSEVRNPEQTPNSKFKVLKPVGPASFGVCTVLQFEFVSDFGFRVSDLART